MTLEQTAQSRLDILAERLAHRIVRLPEPRDGLDVRQPGLLHDDRCLHVPLRDLQQRSASSYSRPVTMLTMRRARSLSFSEPVCTSTIRLP